MLVVWKRHGVVVAVTVVGSTVLSDERVGNGLRSIASGDWGAGDNATIVTSCNIISIIRICF